MSTLLLRPLNFTDFLKFTFAVVMVFEDCGSLGSGISDQQSPDLGHTSHSVSSAQQPDQHSSKSSAEDMAGSGGGGVGVLAGGMTGITNVHSKSGGSSKIVDGTKCSSGRSEIAYELSTCVSGLRDGVSGLYQSAGMKNDCLYEDVGKSKGTQYYTQDQEKGFGKFSDYYEIVIPDSKSRNTSPCQEEKSVTKKNIWHSNKHSEKDSSISGFSLFVRKSKVCDTASSCTTMPSVSSASIKGEVKNCSSDIALPNQQKNINVKNLDSNNGEEASDYEEMMLSSVSPVVTYTAGEKVSPCLQVQATSHRSRLGSIASALSGNKFGKNKDPKKKDRDKENINRSPNVGRSREKIQPSLVGDVLAEVDQHSCNVNEVVEGEESNESSKNESTSKRTKSSYPTFKAIKNKTHVKADDKNKKTKSKNRKNSTEGSKCDDVNDIYQIENEKSSMSGSPYIKNSDVECVQNKNPDKSKEKGTRFISLPRHFKEWRLSLSPGSSSDATKAGNRIAPESRDVNVFQDKWADGISKQYKRQKTPSGSVMEDNSTALSTYMTSVNIEATWHAGIKNRVVITSLSPCCAHAANISNIPVSGASYRNDLKDFPSTLLPSSMFTPPNGNFSLNGKSFGNASLCCNSVTDLRSMGGAPETSVRACQYNELTSMSNNQHFHGLRRQNSKSLQHVNVIGSRFEIAPIRALDTLKFSNQNSDFIESPLELYLDDQLSLMDASLLSNTETRLIDCHLHNENLFGSVDPKTDQSVNASFHSSYLDLYVSPRGEMMPLSETVKHHQKYRTHCHGSAELATQAFPNDKTVQFGPCINNTCSDQLSTPVKSEIQNWTKETVGEHFPQQMSQELKYSPTNLHRVDVACNDACYDNKCSVKQTNDFTQVILVKGTDGVSTPTEVGKGFGKCQADCRLNKISVINRVNYDCRSWSDINSEPRGHTEALCDRPHSVDYSKLRVFALGDTSLCNLSDSKIKNNVLRTSTFPASDSFSVNGDSSAVFSIYPQPKHIIVGERLCTYSSGNDSHSSAVDRNCDFFNLDCAHDSTAIGNVPPPKPALPVWDVYCTKLQQPSLLWRSLSCSILLPGYTSHQGMCGSRTDAGTFTSAKPVYTPCLCLYKYESN